MVEKLCNERVLKLRHSSQQAKQQVLPMILERGLKVNQTISHRRLAGDSQRLGTHGVKVDRQRQYYSKRLAMQDYGPGDSSYLQRIPALAHIDDAYLYPQEGKRYFIHSLIYLQNLI